MPIIGAPIPTKPTIKPKPTPTMPTSGYRCIAVADASNRDRPAVCFHCGKRGLRRVHILEHNDVWGGLDCGCCCAAKLCYGYDAVASLSRAKNQAARLANFATTGWKRSASGNPQRVCRLDLRNPRRRVWLTIFRQGGAWKFVANRPGKEPVFSPESYQSPEAAKAGAFDHVEGLRRG